MAEPHDDGSRSVFDTVIAPPRSLTPRDRALRYGVVRRPGGGFVGGVCLALADGFGLPTRLVRACAVLLGILGIGPLIYLILLILLPRQLPGSRFDTPLQALRRRRPQPGDLVIAAALPPAVLLAGLAVWAYIRWFVLALSFLLPLLLVLLAIVVVGGWQSSRARSAYIVGQIGARAGILTEHELADLVGRLRRDARLAWGADADPRATGRADATTDPGGRPTDPRTSTVLFAIAALTGIAAFSILSLFPHLAPTLNPDGPLAFIGRIGAGASATLALTGAALIVLGLRGRTDTRLVVLGTVCAVALAGSVMWVRLTDSRHQDPVVVSVAEYEPGTVVPCSPGGPRDWSTPVVLDMSALPPPPDPAEAEAQWRAKNPSAPAAESPQLAMRVVCDRPVGDVTVIMPKHSWDVGSDITTGMGRQRGTEHRGTDAWNPSAVQVRVIGRLGVGDVTWKEER